MNLNVKKCVCICVFVGFGVGFINFLFVRFGLSKQKTNLNVCLDTGVLLVLLVFFGGFGLKKKIL